MILGYLDASDRAYDLNFATLRMKIRIEAGGPSGGSRIVFAQAGGTNEVASRVIGETDATASAGMDHSGHLVPLLRPVSGHLYRHERGLLFVASPPKRDPDDPSFFLVRLRAMPSAVKFFFEDQVGVEIVSIPSEEILRVDRVGDSVRISVSAASIALPKETLAYAVELSPASRVAPLLDTTRMSSSG